jgi:hypothetical protein
MLPPYSDAPLFIGESVSPTPPRISAAWAAPTDQCGYWLDTYRLISAPLVLRGSQNGLVVFPPHTAKKHTPERHLRSMAQCCGND